VHSLHTYRMFHRRVDGVMFSWWILNEGPLLDHGLSCLLYINVILAPSFSIVSLSLSASCS
jgi:hypothetical protein